MSASRKIIFGVSVVWFVKAISVLSSLLTLSVFMRVMDREELGTWMVLGNSQVFLFRVADYQFGQRR